MIKNSQDQELVHDDLTFLKVDPLESFDMKWLENGKVDAIIIEYRKALSVLEFINDIRSHNNKEVYLMPVFLYKIHGETDPAVSQLADGEITNLSNLNPLADIAKKIKSRF
ncbi:hypothetical protein LQ318_01020 [Aliifodinibius salicampi]|uniref:Uncharacterized protein n=1 Tax=Fodinibius salicampi TaxID=1920655 RepID=A0ABT3PUE2_9BACT|nr:hypothetical protein [Fodinibius salicampi]MCW9711470.1 hypothetical protein [Fodinibius salicampi]